MYIIYNFLLFHNNLIYYLEKILKKKKTQKNKEPCYEIVTDNIHAYIRFTHIIILIKLHQSQKS